MNVLIFFPDFGQRFGSHNGCREVRLSDASTKREFLPSGISPGRFPLFSLFLLPTISRSGKFPLLQIRLFPSPMYLAVARSLCPNAEENCGCNQP